MESAEAKMMIIVYIDAWYVADLKTQEILSGPFHTQEDACDNMRTRSYRLAQGWPA